MISRREWIALSAAAATAAALDPRILAARQSSLITRAIPSSGEKLPVIGLGTANTFSATARGAEADSLRDVIKAMLDLGGTVVDTAPGYGASEEVSGRLAGDLGASSKIFWATKVNVAGRGGASADRGQALAQIERSFQLLKKPKLDLIQVHNLGDVPTQLAILKELKQQGRVRYIGVTTTSDNQYAELEQIMRNEPIDFFEVDYSIANRNVENVILPLAIERKIGVIVALPFGRESLFRRVAGKPLPDWAKDIDATTWSHFFLKYIVGHPAITVAIPGTRNPEHMKDNMGGGMGRLPDEAMRKRMVEYFEGVATAPASRG